MNAVERIARGRGLVGTGFRTGRGIGAAAFEAPLSWDRGAGAMRAPVLMLQGTGSGVGKFLLTASSVGSPVDAGSLRTGSRGCAGRESATSPTGSASSPDNRRLALLAVCAVEWEMFFAGAVVETHDRVSAETYREAARTCEAQFGGRVGRGSASRSGHSLELGRALVTDAQVRRLREKRMAGTTLAAAAAAAAGMSTKERQLWP